MKKVTNFQKRLSKKEVLILDGGMGTEILRRGVKTTMPLWSASSLLSNPDVIYEIHKDYINAGADIIITNTFRTTKRAFAKAGIANEAKEATLLACELAFKASKEAARDVYVAGSIAPLEDCYSPELTPADKELEYEHLEYAKNLKAGGVDFLLLETMITIRETRAALKAAKKVNMPFAVSFCTRADDRLLSGEQLEDAVKLVEQLDPLFISVNCVAPSAATRVVKKLKKLTKRPIGVYAQGDGVPDDNQGWKFANKLAAKAYTDIALQWVKDGALLIGGCCGTNPSYIENITKTLKEKKH